jgi:hypothetical protein
VKRFFHHHGLTVVLAAFFLLTLVGGQLLTGWHVHNDERAEHGQPALSLGAYALSAHSVEATMENWESEFFQMFVYVVITAFLFQKGSAESNDPDAPRETRRVTAHSPWPVRRGGWWRTVYSHSLSAAFALLFLGSFWFHLDSSFRLENQERAEKKEAPLSFREHLGSAKFWFESFQNWQSEFLAIGSMVVLSIFLREKDSPESKPVEAPHGETGG